MRSLWIIGFALSCCIEGMAGEYPRLGEAPHFPSPEQEAKHSHGPGLAAAGSSGFSVDVASREEARNFFNSVYFAADGMEIGWTGDTAACIAGTTAVEYQEAVGLRINYFRAMAGVPASINLDAGLNQKAQEAALMMSANNTLSHFPPDTWECHAEGGAEAAAKANLALGTAGAEAITGYMRDHGVHNAAVGHRRWILYPQTQTMGTGDVPRSGSYLAANAHWVIDANAWAPRPATREEYVAWPPPGFVPYPVVYPRWSFSYPNADFSGATVSMEQNGSVVSVQLEPVSTGAGERTLVWVPDGLDAISPATRWPGPDQDSSYTVTINNALIDGTPRQFVYTVTVFDPAVPGPDHVAAVISGPGTAPVGQGRSYGIAEIPTATGYQWRRSRVLPLNFFDGAEQGLVNFTAATSSPYEVVVTSPTASGSHAFRLAHPDAEDQFLILDRVLLPGAASQLQFKGRLAWATETQVAKVQVSVNGLFWTDLFSQAGSGDGGTGFQTWTVSLAQFAGHSILVRFNYHYAGGARFAQTQPGFGWHIDDISITGAEELTDLAVETQTSAAFNFIPSELEEYALEARAQVYGGFHLEWGPVKRVTGSAPLPQVEITGMTRSPKGHVEIDFDLLSGATSGFEVQYTAGLPGSWQADNAASVQTIVAGSRYRATTTAGASQRYYRIRILP